MKKLIYSLVALLFSLNVGAQNTKTTGLKGNKAQRAVFNNLAQFKLGGVKYVDSIYNPNTGKTMEVTEYHAISNNRNETYKYFKVKDLSAVTYQIQIYKLIGTDYANAQVSFRDVNPVAMDDAWWQAVRYGYQRLEKWGLCSEELMRFLHCKQECNAPCTGPSQCLFQGGICAGCIAAAIAHCSSQI